MLTPHADLYPSDALYPDDDEGPGPVKVLRDPRTQARRDDDDMLMIVAHFVRML